MKKQEYLKSMNALCEQLNDLIPVKSEADRDKLNARYIRPSCMVTSYSSSRTRILKSTLGLW